MWTKCLWSNTKYYVYATSKKLLIKLYVIMNLLTVLLLRKSWKVNDTGVVALFEVVLVLVSVVLLRASSIFDNKVLFRLLLKATLQISWYTQSL